MEIRQYLEILSRRKWIVIVTTLATVIAVAAATYLMTPIYSATTLVRIAQVQDQNVGYYDLNYSTRLINTYVELLRSRPFLEQAAQRLALTDDPIELSKMVSAEAIPNTELLKITASNHEPTAAMALANALGQLLAEEGERLYTGEGKSARELLFEQLKALESNLRADRERLMALLSDNDGGERAGEVQDLNSRIFAQEQTYSTILNAYEEARLLDEARANSISIAEPAAIPMAPSSPNIPLNLIIAILVGLMGGIGLAFVVENLDAAIYSPEEVTRSVPAPLLASIPNLKVHTRLKSSPILLQPNGTSPAVEAFGLLRTNLQTLNHGRTPRTLLITSVEPDAGKSTVLANLAAALGRSGKNVVVIDCDLRKPSLSYIFGKPNTNGLNQILAEGAKLGDLIQDTRMPGVKMLASGPPVQNPAEILGLKEMRQLVEDLGNWSDLVLLDSPPLMEFSDAVMLAPLVDSVALVASRGGVTRAQLENARSQLVLVGAERIGIVFNRAHAKQAPY